MSNRKRNILSHLNEHSVVIVPPPPQRYTLDEWYMNIRIRNRFCEDQQQLAEKIIAECSRAKEEVEEVTHLRKLDTDHKISERVKDIEFNRNEILIQRKEVVLSLDKVVLFIERVKDSLKFVSEEGINICKRCIIYRESRLGIDLCFDDVERELKKEVVVIEGVINLLQRLLEQCNEQARRLRSCKYLMDRDLEHKEDVLNIDNANKSLTNTSFNLSMYHGFTPLDRANITLEEWNNYTKEAIERAAKEVYSAKQLDIYVNSILKQTAEDLRAQYNAVNAAFNRRIQELKDAKTKLEMQHSEIMRQANDMTINITNLEKSISEKEGYLALAHTRLGNRAQRLGMELCKDLVEISLSNEVIQLRDNLSMLQQNLAESYASLRYLLKLQVQLEEDINVKANSLKIDEVDCMTARQSMDFHAF